MTILLHTKQLNAVSLNTHIPALQSREVTVRFDDIVAHQTVEIPDPNLRVVIEANLGKAPGAPITTTEMATLKFLNASQSNINDLTGLEAAINLIFLFLDGNSISDISALSDLTYLGNLELDGNSISDISAVEGLTNLTSLRLGTNTISDISPVASLTKLENLELDGNTISDILPLVTNTGLGEGDSVDVSENPLSSVSINTHILTLRNRGVEVRADNLKPPTLEYTLSISEGFNLIHLPLKVMAVDGMPKTIESISDLYDALGGASKVTYLITYDFSTQEWRSYSGALDTGTLADRGLTDDMGIIANMKNPISVRLRGNALGTDGSSTIALNQGYNVVGLPLKDSRINRVSDLFTLNGISGNVPVIILTDGGEFKAVGRADDPGDIGITGGQAFIMTAQTAATVALSGEGWTNDEGTAAAPAVSLTGFTLGNITPVLVMRGSIAGEELGLKMGTFRITAKNLSNGKAVTGLAKDDDSMGYRLTAVDIEAGRAAQIGDILEISARSPNPFIGVEPLRHTVTAEDVKRSLIQLPALVAYEIPAETELLPNYPNPFNPETWIPYRLAEDAFVTLTIYDSNGRVVRTLDVGHQVAAVYESRSKAVYWDGRNELGEQVASGVYFYHLQASDFSATRRMVILK